MRIWLNSLAPGRSWCDLKNVIFSLALLIGIFKSSYDDILRWVTQGLTHDKSTLIQVMDWCRQATSHYLNQCWPRSPMPYDVTRPQWVKKWPWRTYLLDNYHCINSVLYLLGTTALHGVFDGKPSSQSMLISRHVELHVPMFNAWMHEQIVAILKK